MVAWSLRTIVNELAFCKNCIKVKSLLTILLNRMENINNSKERYDWKGVLGYAFYDWASSPVPT